MFEIQLKYKLNRLDLLKQLSNWLGQLQNQMLLLLLLKADCHVIEPEYFIPGSTFDCLLKHGHRKIAIRAELINNEQLKSHYLAKAQQKGLVPQLVISACHSQSQIEFALKVLEQLPKGPQNIAWIRVDNIRGCPWNVVDQRQNCKYISEFAERVQNTGHVVGIQTSFYSWATIPGPDCTVQDGNLKLWLVVNPNHRDTPFGGWTVPYLVKNSTVPELDCSFSYFISKYYQQRSEL